MATCKIETKTYLENSDKLKDSGACPPGKEPESSSTDTIIGVILAVIGLAVPFYMVKRERAGTPIFSNSKSKKGIEMHGSSMTGFGNAYDDGTTAESSFINNTKNVPRA